MYTLKTSAHFDSAHFLAGYAGKCSNIHGHRWELVVEVGAETLEAEGQLRGMVVDFATLKADLKALANELDHSLLIEEGSLKPATVQALTEEQFRVVSLPFRPTAENFARYVYGRMEEKGYSVVAATVYETPTNCATYR